jgi:hypothetical protein
VRGLGRRSALALPPLDVAAAARTRAPTLPSLTQPARAPLCAIRSRGFWGGGDLGGGRRQRPVCVGRPGPSADGACMRIRLQALGLERCVRLYPHLNDTYARCVPAAAAAARVAARSILSSLPVAFGVFCFEPVCSAEAASS